MGRSRDRCRIAQAAQTLVPPKVLEPVGRHFGVPDRVLDVLVAEPSLERPSVVAGIGQCVAAGMPLALAASASRSQIKLMYGNHRQQP
jgi:hypothetical protein